MHRLVEGIAESLLQEDFFNGFEFRRRDSTIIKKTQEKQLLIRFQSWAKPQENSYVVLPIYGVRFNILHKWFEPYSKKSLSDQRNKYTIGYEGKMLGKPNSFMLSKEVDDKREIENLRKDVLNNAELIFSEYESLSDLYDKRIEPVVAGNGNFPDLGAEWAFEYLVTTRLVRPEKYNLTKRRILSVIAEMNEHGEPNVRRYFPDLKIILDALEREF